MDLLRPFVLAVAALVMAPGIAEPQEPPAGESKLEEQTAEEKEQEQEQEEEILGSAAAFSLDEAAADRAWLEAGTLLYARPDPDSERLSRIDARIELEVLATEGDWLKVRYTDRLGWVNPELPPRGPDVDIPLLPLAVGPPVIEDRSLERRQIAAAALGLAGPNGSLGPYRLMTDLHEPGVLAHLGRVASGLAVSYRERFGLEPTAPDGQLVVLFQSEETYRRYESTATDLAPYGALGHAGADLAVLFSGEHDLDTVTSLLVHELVHLMNRSTLGATPPPWLEEGIANDLAYCRIDRAGRLLLGTLNGDTTWFGDRRGGSLHYTGALASLSLVVGSRARREETPLSELVALGQEEFLAGERRTLRYGESTFLVRFLLEAEGKRYVAGFRRYVERARDGDPPGARELARLLGEDWKRIERRLSRWLEREAVALLR